MRDVDDIQLRGEKGVNWPVTPYKQSIELQDGSSYAEDRAVASRCGPVLERIR